MTTLTDRPTETGDVKQAASGKRFLVIAVVVLALTSIGLGARAIFDQEPDSTDEEIEQLLDNYLTAWETQDEAAGRSATTEDFVLNLYAYKATDVGGARLDYHVIDDIDGVVSEGFGYNYTVQQVGDSIMTGEGPWFVSVEENWEETSYVYTGQANYTIIEVDGVFKIANHYWAGLRSYQPG